jgi:hypothetical protein
MRLTDLDPQWLRHEPQNPEIHRFVERPEANGIRFLCPKCFEANGGPVRTHGIICWDPTVPPDVAPKPGRWNLVGTSYEDLSLVAGSSSVLLTGNGCQAHFFVEHGSIRMCP